MAVEPLVEVAFPVSAVHGTLFIEGERRCGDVIDPRTGRPAQNALLAAVICPSATDSDALSTGLLTRGKEFLSTLCARDKETKALVTELVDGTAVTSTCGLPLVVE